VSWLKLNDRINSKRKQKALKGEAGGERSPRPSRMTDSERLGYDAVNLPNHYKAFTIEPVHFCVENGLNFLQASISNTWSAIPSRMASRT
jgi:hypothetical protein